MWPLLAWNLDWMADFHRIEPVSDKRVSGEARQLGRLFDFDAMRGPASRGADQKCHEAGGNSRNYWPIAATSQAFDGEAVRWRFVRQMTIAFANEFGLLAPGGDPDRVIGVC